MGSVPPKRDPDMLTVKGVAILLGCSTDTVYRRVADGFLADTYRRAEGKRTALIFSRAKIMEKWKL